jgi:hypothetical protein
LQPLEHCSFTFRIAVGESRGLFERADFQGETRAHVQEPEEFGIDLVNLSAPMIYVHD